MKVLDEIKNAGMLDLALFEISGTRVTLATVITFSIVVIATFIVAGLLKRGVERAFSRSGSENAGTGAVVSRLVRYVVLIVGLGIAVHNVGIDLTALFAAGAVFAVAIGFAMQNISQNFVSGVILLLERVIKPGDVLEVDGSMVKVLDMRIRATIARTLDEEDIIIPNSLLVSSTVKNYTFGDSIFRLRTTVGVVYSSDLALVRRILATVAEGMTWRSLAHPPRVQLREFGDSAVNFEISVWSDDPWSMQSRRDELNDAIWWALKEEGVVIAFPQLDVHFDPPVVDSIEAFRRRGGVDS